eukprot:TRINITY_DN15475_c0_g1_i10.p2 TRINITY_DN15475_c0_g1~~TRINITY_DN15475_c0_g1_i10.p2  ORF type:complete len:120 (+),score=45.91 TRINITY_DN15475_c0_g1_i10:154-513(+)
MRKAVPEKPLTPFFLFKEKMKSNGANMGGKKAGAEWRKLTNSEKQPYIDQYKEAKAKFDKYLEDEGIGAKSSGRKKVKPKCFKTGRIRSICGIIKEIMPMSQNIYKGIGKALVLFRAQP